MSLYSVIATKTKCCQCLKNLLISGLTTFNQFQYFLFKITYVNGLNQFLPFVLLSYFVIKLLLVLTADYLMIPVEILLRNIIYYYLEFTSTGSPYQYTIDKILMVRTGNIQVNPPCSTYISMLSKFNYQSPETNQCNRSFRVYCLSKLFTAENSISWKAFAEF